MLTIKGFILSEETRFGKSGAGVVVFCSSTKNVLWNQRSKYVKEGRTWALPIGGKVEDGESPYDAARREFIEETSYGGTYNLERNPLIHYNEPDFSYTTFLAIVPKQFKIPSFSGVKWEGQWEIEQFFWGSIDTKIRGKLHFGTKYILKNVDRNRLS